MSLKSLPKLALVISEERNAGSVLLLQFANRITDASPMASAKEPGHFIAIAKNARNGLLVMH